MKGKVSLLVFGIIAILGVATIITGIALGGRLGSYTVQGGDFVFTNRHETIKIADAPRWMEDWDGGLLYWRWGDDAYDDANGEVYVTDDSIINAEDGFERVESFGENQLRNLVIDIQIGYVQISVGEDFGLDVQGPMEVDSDFDGGVWNVEQKDDWIDNISTRQIGGVTHFFHDGQDVTTTYVFTVPTAFTELNLNMSMGEAIIAGINVVDFYAFCNMSNLSIDSMNATESKFVVEMGKVVLDDFNGTTTDIDCNMGNVKLYGEVTSELVIDCDMGSVTIGMPQPDGYTYDVDVDMGNVVLDGKRFVFDGDNGDSGSGNSGAQHNGNGTNPYFDIDCGIGNVDINFSQVTEGQAA